MNSKVLLRFAMSALLSLSLTSGAAAAPPYIQLQLPQQIKVELPRNWMALSNNQRITLDAWVAAKTEKLSNERSTAELGFAANLYDDAGDTAGIFNVRYYPGQSITQREAKAATQQDVMELDSTLKANLKVGVESAGGRVLEWRGTRKTDLNGMTVFISEYRRASAQGVPFHVRLVRALDGPRSFTVTVSYREDQGRFLAAISDRIIESVRR